VKSVVVLFPGASLMEITPLDDGLRVRCPGCGNEQVYRGDRVRDFGHEDGCPVYARIQQAQRVVNRGRPS
jgi:predicted RNA-binding Zn-ribbon protein involved in translation (DUF1610 family)